MEARPWPSAAYISSNNGDNSSSAASANRLIIRSGWSLGINASGSMNASMLACLFARPRTAMTSVLGAFTVQAQPAPPEDPTVPSQQAANEASLGPPSTPSGRECEVQL